MIACEDVAKHLGGAAVLRGATVRLEPRKVLVLVGPNGAGKSTLLRVLSGELRPDGGVVKMDDEDLASLGDLVLAKRRAMLPQHVDLVFDFSVRELVMLGRTPHQPIETPACRAMVDRCIARVGLEARASSPVVALSGGERQRAHIARVFAQVGLGESGRYLLLDEPVSNQDPAWQLRLVQELRSLADAGLGVALVLHDLNLAALCADEIALVHAGKVAKAGPPPDVLTPALLGQVFEVEAHVDADPWRPDVPRVSFRR